MVSHTGVPQVTLQHPETVDVVVVVVVVAVPGGGHVVHIDDEVGHVVDIEHVVHIGHIGHELHVGEIGQVVVVVVVFETDGAVQLQHPEVMCVKFIYVVPPPQIGLLQELIVVVVVVASVMTSTEPVYTVLISVTVTVNVFGAGHVDDFEYDGVQGGRVGVYHRADVISLVLQPSLPPPSLPRSKFLASATK